MIRNIPLHRTGDFVVPDFLDAHFGSAREFHASVRKQYEVGSRLAQWIESLGEMLAPRFATSVVLVGTLALLIALIA
jgi:hypothetical protein